MYTRRTLPDVVDCFAGNQPVAIFPKDQRERLASIWREWAIENARGAADPTLDVTMSDEVSKVMNAGIRQERFLTAAEDCGKLIGSGECALYLLNESHDQFVTRIADHRPDARDHSNFPSCLEEE